jgi:hypothetical protein
MTLTLEAEALFASQLQPSDRPNIDQVRAAINATRRDIGEDGCALRLAAEFGDHPEIAVDRMRWALRTAPG